MLWGKGSGQRKKNEIRRTIKKIEKGSGVERGVWNGASRMRRETTSRHAPGPGGVDPERGEGGVESQRKAEGEGPGVRRVAKDEQDGDVRKRGAVSERQRKGNK